MHVHRGDTMQTLFFKGLVELGIEVEPESLVPKRQRRARQRRSMTAETRGGGGEAGGGADRSAAAVRQSGTGRRP